MKLSARNQLKGTVVSIQRGAVNSEIAIKLGSKCSCECDCGGEIVSVITNAAAESLGLEVGGPCICVIKASSVMLGVEG
jgi:molybdate transport system regulatory protein